MSEPSRADAAIALASEYRAAFAGKEKMLEDLFFEAGLFAENSYATMPGNQNPIAIGVFEGRRRLALRVLSMTLGDTRALCAVMADAAARAHVTAPAPTALAPRAAKTENTGAMQ